MIVTIDGPAGAGKSTAARALARRLGFQLLDTGAMYRAVAWAAVHGGVELADAAAMAHLARRIQIELGETTVLVDGVDATREIRTVAITAVTHYAADNPRVRERMVELQRAWAGANNVVAEGRDQGTVVFPRAECKIFLTASPQERARRRQSDLAARGESIPLEQVLADQILRDDRDAKRNAGPLVSAPDATIVWADGLTPDEVVNRLEELAREKIR